MADVGRPSDLTDELTLHIRKFVLDGHSYEDIKHLLAIPDGTWDAWVHKNYKDFRTALIDWKHERMTKKAEAVVEILIGSEDEKVALNASTFVLETLAKKQYSKKTETDITSGGKPIIQIAPEIAAKNNLNEDTQGR